MKLCKEPCEEELCMELREPYKSVVRALYFVRSFVRSFEGALELWLEEAL